MEETMQVSGLSRDQVIEELMTDYGQEVLQLVYTYVHDAALAEDLTQEIFIKCYKALSSYQGKSSLKTWLWRIAINHSKDYIKSWYKKNVDVIETNVLAETLETGDLLEQVVQHSEDDALFDLVMALPVKYRELIYFYYFEEYSIQEIASILSLNKNTVKTRLRKARALLQKALGGNPFDGNTF
ncbi:sigma-70 family RNA polymerase sigma factor [Lysinibacillus sp. G4S2]|uniref:sigma-70 family RNA polymerase sigma factor n=1 Tax=Lysinibacillus sp. G4S2 TaxID=3055859 RepID=UPI0025A2BE4D|nr:sigma-70 family RNA polymerase sigma factor [Lysinibacillus sp. G4S2]MDM5248366.1 sigma-70 family RNA polymerase sigma factor [Lysinibacillus sp. G4S2]